jgi:hypothetical protein
VLFQQLRKHDGGSFVKRTSARNAEHRLIALPLGCKIRSFDDREIRSRIMHGFERRCGLGVVYRFARRFLIVLIDQVVDDLDNSRLDLFALHAIERSPHNVVLGELQTWQGDFVIVSGKGPSPVSRGLSSSSSVTITMQFIAV